MTNCIPPTPTRTILKSCSYCKSNFNAQNHKFQLCSEPCRLATRKILEKKWNDSVTRKRQERLKRGETCTLCGTPYVAIGKRQRIYCSRKCKELRKYKKSFPPMNCKHCAISFNPKTSIQKFCVPGCRDLWLKTKNKFEPKPCNDCGTLFNPRRESQVLCSTHGYKLNPKQRDPNAPLRKRSDAKVLIPCKKCNKEFKTPRYKPAAFCSVDCRYPSRLDAKKALRYRLIRRLALRKWRPAKEVEGMDGKEPEFISDYEMEDNINADLKGIVIPV